MSSLSWHCLVEGSPGADAHVRAENNAWSTGVDQMK